MILREDFIANIQNQNGNNMAKFRKKPITVEVIRCKQPTMISTEEGDMIARVGDWIITGIKGEKYPCKNDIFRETYEPADLEAEKLWLEDI